MIKKPTIEPEAVIPLIIELLDSKKAEDIVVLNISDTSSVADNFIICTGMADRHVRSLADAVEDKLREHKIRPLHVEGLKEQEWIILDYGDLFVHVMNAEKRMALRLEELWGKQKNPEPGLQTTS